MVSFLIGFSIFVALVIADMIVVVVGLVVLDRLERSLHAALVHVHDYAVSHHLIPGQR